MLAALLTFAFQRDGVCYVQTATTGCRIVAYGATMPLRSLRLVPFRAFLQAPAGGSLTVVFRRSGARFRLDGRGQARVDEETLEPVGGAKVAKLSGVDVRLTAAQDRRFGRRFAAGSVFASGPAGGEDAPPLPDVGSEAPPTPLQMPPPLVLPVEPGGIVRADPREIRILPAPPDGPVSVQRSSRSRFVDQAHVLVRKHAVLRTTIRAGVVKLPPGFFETDDFLTYTVLDRAGKELAQEEVRVMTPAQRAELERTERLAEAKGDDESLGALALLYEDLRMPRDANRIYRRLLVRHPDDLGLREKVSGKED